MFEASGSRAFIDVMPRPPAVQVLGEHKTRAACGARAVPLCFRLERRPRRLLMSPPPLASAANELDGQAAAAPRA
ncbi:jg9934 [Pararge aegeria aegeria]|uniref:Jg9934 protein n=1 Tax=Pararge aegeria aegeria TaxID=348720 RepID=A0A8S4S5N3_9NEOP|nr:jg9934 [Pararge aegeria aegeria]